MRKFLATAALCSLALTPLFALAQRDRDDRQDRDDKHGKHERDRGDRDDRGEKHEKHERGEHHDNGRHEGWYKDEHRDWDYDGDRWRPGHAYPRGRYAEVRHAWQCRAFDVRARRVVLYDRSTWVIASYDIPRCRDWYWDRDTVYVYDDDHHPGWYLLFNARLGRYVHVEYFGVGD
jgi:Ni/Co efflux regulator RcnB